MLTIKIHYSRHFPSLFLLSSSYRPPINPVSIPYQSRIGIRKQYGNNTGLIRGRYGNDRKSLEETRKSQQNAITKTMLIQFSYSPPYWGTKKHCRVATFPSFGA